VVARQSGVQRLLEVASKVVAGVMSLVLRQVHSGMSMLPGNVVGMCVVELYIEAGEVSDRFEARMIARRERGGREVAESP
jgi:hypothetical protein